MIEITTLSWSDPLVLLGLGAAGFVFLLLLMAVRASLLTAKLAAPLAHQMGAFGQRVQAIGRGAGTAAGGLHHVSEAHAKAQTNMLQLMEQRLALVQQQMNENLHGSARRIAQSLGDLQQRLSVIDKAQDNITKLSSDVLSLQDILSNKQTRSAYGEIQLNDIVTKALPSDSYTLQATMSNGARPDCLVHLPNPLGHIVIDSKFPLEPYEALRNAKTDRELSEAPKFLRT